MRSSGEIMGWLALGMGTLGTVWRLSRLVLPRPTGRLAHHGAHVRPAGLAETGRRGEQWRDLRYSLLLVAVGVSCLTIDSTDSHAWWLQLGLAPFLLVLAAWDLASWLRSRIRSKPDGPAAESS
jgi:hypothetical protein